LEKLGLKHIDGWERYLISRCGKVFNSETGKLKSQFLTAGYPSVTFEYKARNKKRTFYVHRLLGEYWIGNPEKLAEINHKDGDKKNNELSNLEWVSNAHNLRHAIRTGINQTVGRLEYCIEEVRELISSGMKQVKIAKMFGVSPQLITDIKKGRRYERERTV